MGHSPRLPCLFPSTHDGVHDGGHDALVLGKSEDGGVEDVRRPAEDEAGQDDEEGLGDLALLEEIVPEISGGGTLHPLDSGGRNGGGEDRRLMERLSR